MGCSLNSLVGRDCCRDVIVAGISIDELLVMTGIAAACESQVTQSYQEGGTFKIDWNHVGRTRRLHCEAAGTEVGVMTGKVTAIHVG